MKRVIKIQIEVNTDNNKTDIEEYVKGEVVKVCEIAAEMTSTVRHTKLSGRTGVTESGSQYSITSRKSKQPQVIFFESHT